MTQAISRNVSPANAASLVEVLGGRALLSSQRPAFTFLADGEAEQAHLSFSDLELRARAIAATLQERTRPLDRVVLLYPSGLDFIVAFFGCLFAGVVAVPSYVPSLRRGHQRLAKVLDDAEPRLVLTTSALSHRLRNLVGSIPYLGRVSILESDTVDLSRAQDWCQPSLDRTSLAFLQYTSGSTAAPKGVMVTHGNLLHNEAMIQCAFGQSEESVVVGWLPLFHDMGLIGNVLQPLFVGGSCILMAPEAFLQRPLRWLRAISQYRATTSGGPNFAYDLCVRRVTGEDRRGLDLSSWSVAYSGAEPVRAETLERFAASFAGAGFRRRAFYPCFGLAEATLFVTGGLASAPPVIRSFDAAALERQRAVAVTGGPTGGSAPCRALVGCGRPWAEQRIVIADPATARPLPPDQIGEVWISGPSVAGGYWRRVAETDQTFRVALTDGGEGTFLRTGDLGFLSAGELFITGRLKDLIIIRGRNYYPQDVEHVAESAHASLRPGGGAAFAVEMAGEERLVVVHEVERRRSLDVEEVAAAVRRAVAEQLEVQVYQVVLLPPGSLPKTSSGKVQRHVCRLGFLSGELAVLARSELGAGAAEDRPSASWPSRQELAAMAPQERRRILESGLRERLARWLRTDPLRLPAQRPLTELGLDSLNAVELKDDCETHLGVELPLSWLLNGPDLEQVAEALAAGLAAHAGTATAGVAAMEASAEQGISAGQRALWFLDRLAPTAAANHIAAVARLVPGLEPALLRRAFQDLVDRHPALRTTFETVAGEPVPRWHERLEIDFSAVEARGWSLARFDRRLVTEAFQPFDLARGPLLRLRCFSTSAQELLLLLVVHHMVCDLGSLKIMLDELGSGLAGARPGGSAELAPPPAQAAVPLLAQLDAGRERQLWSVWRRRLAGAPLQLELPSDRPRPPVQTFHTASRFRRLDARLGQRLEELAGSWLATPYTLMLAVFELLLGRLCGQRDLLVGTPVSVRGRAEARRVGYGVNTLALRAEMREGMRFVDLLEQTRQRVVEALDHRDFPFPVLAERLQPQRDPSRSPVVQVLFALQRARLRDGQELGQFALGEAGGHLRLGGFLLESRTLSEGRSPFDLTLMTAPVEGGWALSLQYNRDLFDALAMERMLRHYQALAAAVVREPEQRLGSLSLLSAAERFQIVAEWNVAPAAPAPDTTLSSLFFAQVERTPQALALVFQDRHLSYAELGAGVEALARRLRPLGIGPEARVAVCVRREPRLVVALLAVLRAGGAYVPLDPEYPATRLRLMLEDCGAALVLADSATAASLPATAVRRVLIDAGDEAAAESVRVPDRTAGAGNLAYLIYTSGSSGTPKGVAIEHRSAVAMVRWASTCFAAGDLAGVLASTSICFDLSVFELFAPLCSGGTVVLAGNALELPKLPAKDRVTLVNTVPSAVAELLRSDGWAPSVRIVNLAGEALRRSLVDRIYARREVREVWNLYGPSEDTTYSTCALVERCGQTPPIGRPITGSRAYVVGAGLEPQPVGVPGELLMGGAGLARGYLDRAGATAEKFVPDPFAGVPGSRLYRTGDMARYRRDGSLEFLGRNDHQVKLRGFRIELREVETVLEGHPEVLQAVVAALEMAADDQRLVAYFVPALQPSAAEPKTPSAGVASDLSLALRRFMRDRLPAHAVPDLFVMMASLPLSPNGKVDRRALPGPCLEAAAQDAAGAPRGADEELLAGIWSQLLGRRVRRDESFFELGGHSLLATRLIHRVREILGVELPVAALFEAPTLAAFGRRVEAARRGGQPVLPPPLGPQGREQQSPLSFSQERLWFLDQLERRLTAYNMSFVLELMGELSIAALERSFAEIVRRHEVLRAVFVAPEGRPEQEIVAPHELALPLCDLSALSLEWARRESYRLARRASRRPFDLSRGPLYRPLLLRPGGRRHHFLLTVHHIVFDGGSVRILIAELGALYRGFATGAPVRLAELPVRYADFAAWQRRWLAEADLAPALAYWRQRLSGAPAVLELPADRPRPAKQTYLGGTVVRVLPVAKVDVLKTLARQQGLTLFMLFLATFKALLQRLTGEMDLVLGSPVAHRDQPQIENLIGFFVNTLVLRTDLAGDPGFVELLVRVRETVLGALAHREVPFEKLVEELRPERGMSHHPFFQVVLNFDESSEPPGPPGLAGELVEVDNGGAKFDLMLTVGPATGSGERGLAARLEHSRDLFDTTTACRFLGHLFTLLSGVLEDCVRRLSELPVLSPSERHELLVEWNPGAGAATGRLCLHQLFEQQASSAPGAVAVSAVGGDLTYGELNLRANRLAHELRARGVGPEVLVGVCLKRAPELVVALLAVLKAGGAYLPLDIGYPAERLNWMLEDSGVRLVLCDEGLEHLLPRAAAELVAADWKRLGRPGTDAETPATAVGPANLAYVLYTSGSTGRPKSIAIAHHGPIALVRWAAQHFSAPELDGVLASTSICFDLSVFEVFVPLSLGGRVVIAESLLALHEVATWTDVRLVNTVPSVLGEGLRENRLPDAVRTVNLAGEPLSRGLADRTFARSRIDRLMNLYGPSEDTTYSTAAAVPARGGAPDIGFPIAGGAAYVVDRQLRPVPVGVAGELCLTGPGGARGYLGRCGLTAAKFVPAACGGEPGTRLYRTGDLARRRRDGRLEYLGRRDHQVKVRGFRIEPGEVEAALDALPEVRESVVVAAGEASAGERRLVAYVVPAAMVSEPAVVKATLRRQLTARLPAHLVPSSFVIIEALPLSPNGKVDRRRLPAPDGERPAPEKSYMAPRNDVERRVAEIWQELLGVDRVGIQDSFFELGGHSLLAAQVVSRVRRGFGVELELHRLFETPTVAHLAAIVEAQRGEMRAQPRAQRIERVRRGRSDLMDLVRRLDGLSAGEEERLLQAVNPTAARS